MSKKTISYIVAFSMIFAVMAIPRPALAAGVYAEAVADAESGYFGRNIEWSGSQNGVVFVQKGGEYTFRLTEEKNSVGIDIRDSAIHNHRTAAARVTVKYYDEGFGAFALQYDSFNEALNRNVMKYTEEVAMTNTGGWKEHVFQLDDAALSNHGAGTLHVYDLAVRRMRGEAVYIRSVRIEGVDENYIRDPIEFTITSDSLGHTFDTGTQTFQVHIKNYSFSEWNVPLRAVALNSDGERIWFKTFGNIPMQSGEERNLEVTLNVRNTGYFRFVLEAAATNGDGREIVCSNEQDFTVIKKLTPEENNIRMGVSAHLGGKTYKRELVSAAAAAGFGIVRDELIWQDTEKEKNVFSVPDKFKNIPEYIAEDSMEPLLILCFGNTLYTDGERDVPTTDEQIAAFKEYCRFMAQTYKGVVKNYEVWNEYNYVEFNKYLEGSDVYVKLLRAAYEAVKEVDSEARIIGVTAGGSDENNGLKFMSEVFQKGGLQYMDAVSFHPYQWNRQSDMNKLRDDLRNVRNRLAEHGSNIPIWVTEMGWSSGTSEHCISEEEQAVSAVQMYATAMSSGNCDRIIWYNLQNSGVGNVTGEREHNFGLIRNSGHSSASFQAKPVYVAFAAMNRLIGNADYMESIYSGDTVIHKFQKKDGSYSAVIWNSDERDISLKTGSSNVTAYDIYGDILFSSSRSDGIYSLRIGREPVYICGDLGGLAVTYDKRNIEVSASPTVENGVFNDILGAAYNVAVKNFTDVPVTGTLLMSVRSMDNAVVAQQSEPVVFERRGSVIVPFAIENLDKGSYDITFEYSFGDGARVSETEMMTVIGVKSEVDSGITFTDSGFCAQGVTKLPYTEVTVLARDMKTPDVNAYVEQVTSDQNGIYSINGKLPKQGMFKVMVYDGALHRIDKNTGNTDYFVKLMRGTEEITQITDIRDGDELTAVVNVVRSAGDVRPLQLYSVLSGAKGLIDAQKTDITADGNEYRVTFRIEKSADISSIYFLLWTKDMEPVSEKQTIY